nr:hypothetical protein [uncultured Subdoligranulum sp.]
MESVQVAVLHPGKEVLNKGIIHLGIGGLLFFQKSPQTVLELGIALTPHLAAKAQDGGSGHMKLLGQFPDGHARHFFPVGNHIVIDHDLQIIHLPDLFIGKHGNPPSLHAGRKITF